MNDNRVRVDLVKLAVAIARYGLVVPVRIKLPIRYRAFSGAPLDPSGPNEPGHPDQEEEEYYPSSYPGYDGDEVRCGTVRLLDIGRVRVGCGGG